MSVEQSQAISAPAAPQRLGRFAALGALLYLFAGAPLLSSGLSEFYSRYDSLGSRLHAHLAWAYMMIAGGAVLVLICAACFQRDAQRRGVVGPARYLHWLGVNAFFFIFIGVMGTGVSCGFVAAENIFFGWTVIIGFTLLLSFVLLDAGAKIVALMRHRFRRA